MDNLYFGWRRGTSEDDDDDDDDSAKNENDTGRGGRRGSGAESGEHNGRPNFTRRQFWDRYADAFYSYGA